MVAVVDAIPVVEDVSFGATDPSAVVVVSWGDVVVVLPGVDVVLGVGVLATGVVWLQAVSASATAAIRSLVIPGRADGERAPPR